MPAALYGFAGSNGTSVTIIRLRASDSLIDWLKSLSM